MINKENINTVTAIYDVTSSSNNFNTYKVTFTNSDIFTFVPLDEANTDYQAIQEWIAEGGVVIDNPPSE
jgi:hypothetical protein